MQRPDTASTNYIHPLLLGRVTHAIIADMRRRRSARYQGDQRDDVLEWLLDKELDSWERTPDERNVFASARRC